MVRESRTRAIRFNSPRWTRGSRREVRADLEPGVGFERIGADTNAALQGFGHIPAGTGLPVCGCPECPADSFGRVRIDALVFGGARAAEEEHVSNMVGGVDVSVIGRFSVPLERIRAAKVGGEAVG